MVKQYAFIDESGDLGPRGSTHFVVAAAIVYDPHRLSRIIKKVRKNRMRKSLKALGELKANNTDDIFKQRIYELIARSDTEIYATVIDKRKVRSDLYRAKEKLYNYLCGLLIKLIAKSREEIEIVLDQKSTNKATMEDIRSYIWREVRQRWPNCRVSIHLRDSQFSPPLQVTDFIAWAVYRKFSRQDSRWYDRIKARVKNAGSEELWNTRK